jgi:hypothetical protein
MRTDPYEALLRSYSIWTPGVAMFRRAVFGSVGGFDASLHGPKDYELYLRVASEFPIHHHDGLVVDWRQHGANTTRDSARMLRDTLKVLRSQRERVRGTREYEQAYKQDIKSWQSLYGNALFKDMLIHARKREWRQVLWDMSVLIRHDPGVFLRAYRELRALARDRSYASIISAHWRDPWHKAPKGSVPGKTSAPSEP